MMMLLSAVLAAVKNDMFYRQCRRKPETKKAPIRADAQIDTL